MAKNSLSVNVYEVLSRAVEEGLRMGWNRAHKHDDNPNQESIIEHQHMEIMNAACEVFNFSGEK